VKRIPFIDLVFALALALPMGCGASAASIRRDAQDVRERCRETFMRIAREAETEDAGNLAIADEEARCEAEVAEICDRPGDPCHE
jgi:hypothetical protein